MNFRKLEKYFRQEYDFRVGQREDLPLILDFIENHWQKNHALVLSRALMDWQHFDPIRNRYNFFIAVHKASSEIHALQGFIPTSQYDPEIENPLIMGAIWKARDDATIPGIGMMVRLFGETEITGCARGGLGLSNDAAGIDKHLNLRHGICNHFYLLNPTVTEFKIAGNIDSHTTYPQTANDSKKTFTELDKAAYLALPDEIFETIPFYKSKMYFVNRFFRHPIYDYRATLVSDQTGAGLGVFFWRICEAESTRCIRIVEMFMKPGALAGNQTNFENLLQQHEAEYIDCYNIGYPESDFYQAGFSERHQSEIIIPNYFEPFVRKNCELNYTLITPDPDFKTLFFKADGDQDRPNRVSHG